MSLLKSLRLVIWRKGAHLRKLEIVAIVRKLGTGEKRTVICGKLN